MRFTFHLMHNDPHNNTKKSPRVPLEMKEEIRLTVHDKNKVKTKKVVDIQEIHAQLHGIMGAGDTHLIDEDIDDEDVEDADVYMYRQICTQMSGMHIDLEFMAQNQLNGSINNMKIL